MKNVVKLFVFQFKKNIGILPTELRTVVPLKENVANLNVNMGLKFTF